MGLAAFSGLGQGIADGLRIGMAMREQERQAERQAKIDEQNAALTEERLSALRDEKESRANQKLIDEAIAKAGKAGEIDNGAAGVTYTDASGQQKTAYQPDIETAKFAAAQTKAEQEQMDAYKQASQPASDASSAGTPAAEGAAPAPVAAPPGPSTATNPQAVSGVSVRDLNGNHQLYTGIDAATQAKQFSDQNQPGSYAYYMSVRNKLASMVGGQRQADEYLKRAKEAQKEGVFETLMELKSKNPDRAKAKSIFNSAGTYKLADNENFVQEIGADGKPTGKWNIVQTGADGKETVTVPDVESYAQDRILGSAGIEAAYKSKLASQAKIAEEMLKPVALNPQQVLVSGGKVIAENTTPPKGFKWVTDDATGKTSLVPLDDKHKPGAVPDVIKETLKGNEGGISTATSISANVLLHNQGTAESDAHDIGIRAALSKPDSFSKVFNPATGKWDRYFNDSTQIDKDGKQVGFATNKTYKISDHEYAPGLKNPYVTDAEAKEALKVIEKQYPKEYGDYVKAATDPAAATAYRDNLKRQYNELVAKSKADVEAVRSNKDLTPQQKEASIQDIANRATKAENAMLGDQNRLGLVIGAYKAQPVAPAPAKDNKAPTAAERLKTPGGMGAAPEYALRDAAKKDDARVAEQKKRDEEAEARSKEIKGQASDARALTSDVIRAMTPQDALDRYNKYFNVLSPSQKNDLLRRIPPAMRPDGAKAAPTDRTFLPMQ